MTPSPEALYLDLTKKALAFALWPEPPTPIEAFNYARPPGKRLAVSFVSRLLRPMRLQLVRYGDAAAEDREEGRIWPGYAHTMIGLRRLDNLQYCIEKVLRERVQGDLIETGVWRGGACIFMRACLAAYGVRDRKVYVADSFEGLPKPNAEKFPADKGDTHHIHEYLAVSQEEVADNFRNFGLLDEQVVFLKGWFEDTLPSAPIDRLAVLRLDGDMYSSTIVALKNLYPKLSTGGFCIIDDYALAGCKRAVDDFRAENGIAAELKVIDRSGRYWRKE